MLLLYNMFSRLIKGYKHRLIFIIIIIGVVAGALFLTFRVSASFKESQQEQQDREYQERFTNKDYIVQKNDSIALILQDQALLDYDTVTQIVNSITGLQKITIKEGQKITFRYFDGIFQGLNYDINDQTFINVVWANGQATATVENIEYEVEIVSREGTISTSFYADGTAVGLTPRVIMELAGVFAWDIDFVNSLYEGDSFSLVFEKLIRDGEFVGTRDILAARFTNDGQDFYAYRVVDDKGNIKYYDENGDAKKRLLLKTPLNFKRISSQFVSSRKHPVTGQWRAHKGIDLAASTGTPVETVGDGVVTFAGTNGGYGKFIKINHGQGFVTAYAHLSKINVKKGARVTQGQLIGAVGTTGVSTGPHLHYEMYKNGNVVHPFNTSVPKDVPIAESLRSQLEDIVSTYKQSIQNT